MTQPPGADSSHGAGVPSALAFAVSGVVSEGDAGPRLGYRCAGEGYDPARRVAGVVVGIDDGVSLRFALPAASVDFILLEPAAISGHYSVTHMVYAGTPVDDLARRVMAAHERLGDAAGPGAIAFSNDRGRPSLELDVRGLGAVGGGQHLELVLRREADGVAAADAFARVLAAIGRGQDADHAAGARLARTLQALSARMDGLAAAIDTRADGPGQSGLADAIQALVAAGAARDERIAGLERQLVALAGVLGRTETSLAALAPMVENASAIAATAREQSARDGDALRAELASLHGQVRHVADSIDNLFWRRWARRLRGGGR
ncbi:hypothetical protein H5368_07515 [Luteimonas sp. MC1782]|uniref:hypothetical protein n=1 Tax=Luteimonas sp. MC1782 TaxID=2760305 RepID=UPI00160360EC|nr:hypothetical protein [Luteimonas sp. MC1782]MBB1472877.1 hypothetical protein [Luteimonas sp. MC1782]